MLFKILPYEKNFVFLACDFQHQALSKSEHHIALILPNNSFFGLSVKLILTSRFKSPIFGKKFA